MRIKSVVRLLTANKFVLLILPAIILVTAFALILAIGVLVGFATGGEGSAEMFLGMRFNGAIFSVMGPLMGFGFTAMGQYFPLATGLGLTRKEFAAGAATVFLGYAASFAALTTLGRVVEQATGGWWLKVRFFDVVWTGAGSVWTTPVQTFLAIAAMMFVGAAIMTAILRWGQTFLWLFLVSLAMVAVAVVGAALLNHGFAAWLGGLFGMAWGQWMAVLAAIGVLAAGTWFVLVRRAQAR